jgi:hypothetical protein
MQLYFLSSHYTQSIWLLFSNYKEYLKENIFYYNKNKKIKWLYKKDDELVNLTDIKEYNTICFTLKQMEMLLQMIESEFVIKRFLQNDKKIISIITKEYRDLDIPNAMAKYILEKDDSKIIFSTITWRYDTDEYF